MIVEENNSANVAIVWKPLTIDCSDRCDEKHTRKQCVFKTLFGFSFTSVLFMRLELLWGNRGTYIV